MSSVLNIILHIFVTYTLKTPEPEFDHSYGDILKENLATFLRIISNHMQMCFVVVFCSPVKKKTFFFK